MTKKMSIRELTRNGNMFKDFDYIDIEDKKTKEYKGVFVSEKYALLVKHFLEEEIKRQKEKALDEIMQFAGIMNGETQNLSMQELKAQRGKTL